MGVLGVGAGWMGTPLVLLEALICMGLNGHVSWWLILTLFFNVSHYFSNLGIIAGLCRMEVTFQCCSDHRSSLGEISLVIYKIPPLLSVLIL